MQAQTTTIIAPQEHAPWYSRYQVPWPEATVGNWRIERFQVSEADEKFGRMRALFSSFAEDHLGELYLVRGGTHSIECVHGGDGCAWAGEGIFVDGLESGDTGRWSQ